MCFYEATEMACQCWRWGPFRQHCAKEYRTGETCGMKLVWNRYQHEDKCEICQKIDRKEKRIRRAEQELRQLRRQLPKKAGKQWQSGHTPIGWSRENDQVLETCLEEEARIREMKLEVVVLNAMLPEMPDKDHILATASARPLTSPNAIRWAKIII